MVAYLLSKRDTPMSYMKILKLLYLADRESMARFAESISGDDAVSMKHGPVLSKTYDLIKNNSSPDWCEWIKKEPDHDISLKKRNFTREDLEELRDIDLKILDQVFDNYQHLDRFQMVNYLHENCPEWQNPGKTSKPIRPESIFKALKKTDEEVQCFIDFYYSQKDLLEARKNILA